MGFNNPKHFKVGVIIMEKRNNFGYIPMPPITPRFPRTATMSELRRFARKKGIGKKAVRCFMELHKFPEVEILDFIKYTVEGKERTRYGIISQPEAQLLSME